MYIVLVLRMCVCLYNSMPEMQHIFIAYDEENMYSYVYSRDTVRGQCVCSFVVCSLDGGFFLLLSFYLPVYYTHTSMYRYMYMYMYVLPIIHVLS